MYSFLMGAGCVVLGVGLAASSDWGFIGRLGALLLIALAAYFLGRATFGFDALSLDLRDGVVRSADGEVSREKIHVTNPLPEDAFFLQVDGRRLRATEQQFNAAPSSGRVRLYYLGRCNRAVNWESMPETRPASPSRG